jgi:hypothetical protein
MQLLVSGTVVELGVKRLGASRNSHKNDTGLSVSLAKKKKKAHKMKAVNEGFCIP